MQIGAPANNFAAPPPDQGIAASAIRQEMDLDTTIASYYSQLHARAPLYADITQASELNTMTGVRILEQLMALNGKAMSLLAEHRGDAGESAVADLNTFMVELTTGGLSDQERNYFYSKPFKGKFEQMVATADRAAPENREAAMNALEALGTMVRDPRKFLLRVTANTIAKDFADAFNLEVARHAGRSNYPVA